jgi:hypothetical protein
VRGEYVSKSDSRRFRCRAMTLSFPVMLVRSILSSFLLFVATLPAVAHVDERDIARDVYVGRYVPLSLPMAQQADAIGLALDPFEAIALSWRTVDSDPADPAVRVRTSEDGDAWSEWTRLTIDGDVTNRSEGRYATGIAHFGGSKRRLQISIDRSVDRLTVTTFPAARPGASPSRRASTEGFKFGAVDVRSRTEWGCPDGESSRWTPAYTKVTHAVLHHTAGANSVADWDAELRSIWYLHTITNGWGDIGYNFLIDPNGVAYEGRAGGDGAIGAHFSCRNSNTVGVSLLGTYSVVPPTAAALASLKALLAEVCSRDSIDPTAIVYHPSTAAMLPTILGHRDGNSLGCTVTECPGDAFYALIPAIRTDLACEPSIEVQPASITIAPGGSATLSVVAGGSAPPSFQWYSGASGSTDSPLPGAISSSVTVSPATLTSYWVRVSSPCGSVDSAAAIVNVSTAGRTRAVRR